MAPDEDTRAFTISILEGYAGTVIDQLHANSSDYLPGGTIHTLFADGDDGQREEMNKVPLTSDSIERLFGVFDQAMTSTPNLHITTATGMTAYR